MNEKKEVYLVKDHEDGECGSDSNDHKERLVHVELKLLATQCQLLHCAFDKRSAMEGQGLKEVKVGRQRPSVR